MIQPAATPYVWLAPAPSDPRGGATPGVPSDAEDARVRAWVGARGAMVARVAASTGDAPSASNGGLGESVRVVEEVEAALGAARDALAALDTSGVEAALARAETAIREHPELPQAVWLRAEIDRAWATRYARAEPRDEARATRAWKRAAALDGGRVPGIGEAALGDPTLVTSTLEFADEAGLEVRVDGEPKRPGALRLGEAEHQFVVRRRGRLVWAAWVGVAEGTVVTLPTSSPAPCSGEDFEGVRAESGRLHAINVRCARWFVVVANPSGQGSSIAQCSGPRCGVAVAMASPRALSETPSRSGDVAKRASEVTWLTWTVVSASALITSAAFVIASGAFDKPDRSSRFVAGGLRVE